MKKWLQIVQKYIFPTATIMFGVLFIYSLIFATPMASLVRTLVNSAGIEISGRLPNAIKEVAPTAVELVHQTETIARTLMMFGIVGLVLGGLTLIYRSQLRKKYYITNYVVIGLFSAYLLGMIVYIFAVIVPYIIAYNQLDFAAINELLITRSFNAMEGNSFFHILSYLFVILFLFALVNIVLLLIDKIRTQVKENKENGFKQVHVVKGGRENA